MHVCAYVYVCLCVCVCLGWGVLSGGSFLGEAILSLMGRDGEGIEIATMLSTNSSPK